ncbi:cupin domain-containing protein [Emticicia sp. BO119]|uniref:cupin domain-containing protein n=1 Tax=Emticicia sp. BO119 TaxID=2757768 RepID=UPI0015F0A5E5|nr:cupin domain-containing protein [Emticicia sp. BO119]MBA4851325.1 cupin domain-containing protein [Emticicia sp. BO119]
MINISELALIEVITGFKARFVHTDKLTLAYWEIEKGAILPMHAHIHEQITTVLEGRFELTIGQETKVYENGLLAVIPPNVIHRGKALTDCKIYDVFYPVREDYKLLSNPPVSTDSK